MSTNGEQQQVAHGARINKIVVCLPSGNVEYPAEQILFINGPLVMVKGDKPGAQVMISAPFMAYLEPPSGLVLPMGPKVL